MVKEPRHKKLRKAFRQAIWPKMGWGRVARYYRLRIYRLDDTPYAIAAGLACGVAVSFTPFMGLHMILSVILARILNGSMIAAVLGSFTGNPWTFPLIWILTYKIGIYILGVVATTPPPDIFILDDIFDHPLRLFLPMLIGSLPCAILAWLVTYFPMRDIIIGFQHQRHKRRALARLKNIRQQPDENTAPPLQEKAP